VQAVTQDEYEQIVGSNPSRFKGEGKRPVERVQWLDAVKFCNDLSQKERLDTYYDIKGEQVSIRGGSGYRLPTEAEWEYACRAGTTTRWSCGDDGEQLKSVACYGRGWEEGPIVVGQKEPNPWGLYDMHGNVWEWCWDWFGNYASEDADDPTGPATGDRRVCRGGSFYDVAAFCRSAFRLDWLPANLNIYVGFRVSRT